jgi:hypothetical protein
MTKCLVLFTERFYLAVNSGKGGAVIIVVPKNEIDRSASTCLSQFEKVGTKLPPFGNVSGDHHCIAGCLGKSLIEFVPFFFTHHIEVKVTQPYDLLHRASLVELAS